MAQASLQGNLKYSVEYKAPAQKVYDFWTRKQYEFPKLLPDNLHNVELLEGTWVDEGSLLKWTYVVDGKVPGYGKCSTEKLDPERKFFSYKVTEGILLGDKYKSLDFVGQITPKDDGSCLANWSFVYEKLNENVPDPIETRDLAMKVDKVVNDYLADQD